MAGRITVKGGSTQKMVVTSTPKNRILINTYNGTGAGGVETLVQLKDVDASDIDDNETIVYDAASGKFKVEELPLINGGEF
jgi:hypothetical protein